VQDRGLAAYIAELIGTLFLVFIVGSVVSLYVSTTPASQVGSDFAVVGLVHAFVLFGLIISFGQVSGGHFNPVVTMAAAALRRIDPMDAIVYVLAQLSGGVLGALLVKGLLLDEGRATSYGNAEVSSLLGSNVQGGIVEALGALLLVLVICAVALNPRARHEWAPWAIGATLGFAVMVLAPLTGGAFNPARWFGPALIGDAIDASDLLVYVLGPIVGAAIAVAVYRFVIAGPQYALGPEPPTTATETVENVAADVTTRVRSSEETRDRRD
jgi:MIP family channel proteins